MLERFAELDGDGNALPSHSNEIRFRRPPRAAEPPQVGGGLIRDRAGKAGQLAKPTRDRRATGLLAAIQCVGREGVGWSAREDHRRSRYDEEAAKRRSASASAPRRALAGCPRGAAEEHLDSS